MSVQTTTIEDDNFNLDEFLPMPGAESVVTGDEGASKRNSIFTAPAKADLSFLDKSDEEEEEAEGEESDESGTPKAKTAPEVETSSVLDELDPELTGAADDEPAQKGGRKKGDAGMTAAVSKLIEDGVLFGFEDDKPLEEYTTKDFKELIEANFQEREKQLKEQTPKEFFEALPNELQYAAKYVADGGADLKGLFRVLAQVEESRALDPANERDQEQIVRQYLVASNVLSQDEIDEQIEEYKEGGVLAKWAGKHKPKLDAMQEQVVKQKLAAQEKAKENAQKTRDQFMNNVYNTLKPGELNGMKLDTKKQQFLWNALTQTTHESISGRPTNLLGNLLEKYQFGEEPRYDLIAEATWLLSDPEDYKSHLRQQAKNDTAQETARTLKTEQARKLASTSQEEEKPSARKITRQPTNIFRR
jgi:hypothetical protein